MNAAVIGLNKAAGACNGAHQAVVQCCAIEVVYSDPVQASDGCQTDVLADNVFGDVQGGADFLMREPSIEFDTQNAFDLAHSDPSDMCPVQQSRRGNPNGLEKYAEHTTLLQTSIPAS